MAGTQNGGGILGAELSGAPLLEEMGRAFEAVRTYEELIAELPQEELIRLGHMSTDNLVQIGAGEELDQARWSGLMRTHYTIRTALEMMFRPEAITRVRKEREDNPGVRELGLMALANRAETIASDRAAAIAPGIGGHGGLTELIAAERKRRAGTLNP